MIRLFDDWAIDADQYGLTCEQLVTRENKQTGKTETYFKRPRYYGSMESALQGVWTALLRERMHSHDLTLKTALQGLRELQQGFMEALELVRCVEKPDWDEMLRKGGPHG